MTGLAIFVAFGSGAAAQTTTTSWPLARLFVSGTISAIAGLGGHLLKKPPGFPAATKMLGVPPALTRQAG
jgi:hypothetical protein